MKRLGWLVVVLVLGGCSEEPEKADGAVSPEPAAKPASAVSDAVASGGYGEYRKNDSAMVIRDHVHRWVKDENKLVVIQTPQRLSNKERGELAGGKNDFMVLFDNETPDPKKWTWYPYVVTEIAFESSEIRADNIQYFYIKAYGIEKENHTDNLNASPGKNAVFKTVSLDDGKLTLEYSGHDSIMEDEHRWNIAIRR